MGICIRKQSPESLNTDRKVQALINRREQYHRAGMIRKVRRDLVVDDNAMNRAVQRRYLEQEGIQCDEANNGMVALEMMVNQDYQMVWMDLCMPILDGNSTARYLKRPFFRGYQYQGPIVAVTAFADQDTERQVKEHGMSHLVPKPYSFKEIMKIRKTCSAEYTSPDDRPAS